MAQHTLQDPVAVGLEREQMRGDGRRRRRLLRSSGRAGLLALLFFGLREVLDVRVVADVLDVALLLGFCLGAPRALLLGQRLALLEVVVGVGLLVAAEHELGLSRELSELALLDDAHEMPRVAAVDH